jgi:hypothetical protein
MKTEREEWYNLGGFRFPHPGPHAQEWERTIRRIALDRNVLMVATTRIEGAWKCYIGPVPGRNHDEEWIEVFSSGSTVPEAIARAAFPAFADIPYAR